MLLDQVRARYCATRAGVDADAGGLHRTRRSIKKSRPKIKKVLVLDRPFVKRSAWFGTESLPHVFYENFKSFSQRELPIFKTREEAMDWLVE